MVIQNHFLIKFTEVTIPWCILLTIILCLIRVGFADYSKCMLREFCLLFITNLLSNICMRVSELKMLFWSFRSFNMTSLLFTAPDQSSPVWCTGPPGKTFPPVWQLHRHIVPSQSRYCVLPTTPITLLNRSSFWNTPIRRVYRILEPMMLYLPEF